MKFAVAGTIGAVASLLAGAALAANVEISSHDIGGQVAGDKGPEAGVWVIAETKDLPTKYAKVVVTDDQGRFVIPDLPDANYKVWVRGYGLQDTAQQDAQPGKLLDFKARLPLAAAADAQNYPGMYWYSMLDIPKPEEFPGTGDKGNKMPETMKSPGAVGRYGQEHVPVLPRARIARHPRSAKEFMDGNDSHTAWALRTQAGQAQEYMAMVLGQHGAGEGLCAVLEMDRSHRRRRTAVRQAGAAEGHRAQRRLHDVGLGRRPSITSTMRSRPTSAIRRVNANGLIYGSPEESTDLVPTLDPVKNVAGDDQASLSRSEDAVVGRCAARTVRLLGR